MFRKNIQRAVSLLAIISLMMIHVLFTGSSPASATSIYDSAIRQTTDLKFGKISVPGGSTICSVEDRTSDWSELILGSSNTSAVNSFRTALASGSWFAMQQYANDSGRLDYQIVVVWDESGEMDIDWKDGSYATTPASPTQHYMVANHGSPYNDSCTEVVSFSTGSVMTISHAQSTAPDISGYPNGTKLFGAASSGITYPSNYAGYTAPYGSRPHAIAGRAICSYGSTSTITNIAIDAQIGVDGNATIADDGSGGKNYSFYLSQDSPYQIKVQCDESIFLSPLVEDDFYNPSLYDWDCIKQNLQFLCSYA